MSDKLLIIFIKYPEPGYVKTRLAESIGDKRAAFLYRLFVEVILARTGDKSFDRKVFYYPPDKRREIIDWIGEKDKDIEFLPQEGDDLGTRLSNAFKGSFAQGAKGVVIIGSDSPAIDASAISRAFAELEKKQCAIGPSQDGGYYLLGLSSYIRGHKTAYNDIFKKIEWSTDKVFRQTIEALERLKLSFSILDEDIDVDSPEDLVDLKARLKEVNKINPEGLGFLIKAL